MDMCNENDKCLSLFFFCLQGIPSPQTEHGAIEAVVMYAVTKLGFTLDNIILFAWSIGE